MKLARKLVKEAEAEALKKSKKKKKAPKHTKKAKKNHPFHSYRKALFDVVCTPVSIENVAACTTDAYLAQR